MFAQYPIESFPTLLMIILTVVIADNYVLSQFLGICPFLGVSKKLDSASGMGFAVTFVMVLASLVTWPIQRFLLDPFGIGYLQTVVFILVIAALVQVVEMFLKKKAPSLYTSLGVFLPLITTNCAVLGVTIMNIDSAFSWVGSVLNAFGAGIGFLLAMVLFSGVRQRMEACDIPGPFKGVPSVLVAASILAMSFMGFNGVVEGIFS